MQFFKSVAPVASILPSLGGITAPRDLDVHSTASILNVASSIAFGTMSYYTGNVSSDPIMVGNLPHPTYYWWEAGSLWNNMLDYYHYTGDSTYNDEVIHALLAPQNMGVNKDYVPADHQFEEGNDDLGFWGGAVLTAAEMNFPQPDPTLPSWLQLAENVFNSLVSRWDTSHCGGGLLWQIYADNPNGLTYKNSISNGGLLQIAARLYRATGNNTYLDWATTVWDWSSRIGLVDGGYFVFDGVGINNCGDVNKLQFTYAHGIYLHAAATLANVTNSQVWSDRTVGLLASLGPIFFNPPKSTEPIMYEEACEPYGTCNSDMYSHKATLARFMWKTAAMQPGVADRITATLTVSALAAAQACTGGSSGRDCGAKWYIGGYDGTTGLGQEMSALAVIQGLLATAAPPPLAGSALQVVREKPWASAASSPSSVSTRSAPLPPTTSPPPSAAATPTRAVNSVRGRTGVRSVRSVLIDLRSAILVHLKLV